MGLMIRIMKMPPQMITMKKMKMSVIVMIQIFFVKIKYSVF